ncbi:MAG: M56 family metallopeptidase [Acetatifactor sp.]|nr:M56 family metallopeptidase [Acetatifactor sp.]MDE7045791.1 M56 family metallopeptidase [Acetatifactor sp.]
MLFASVFLTLYLNCLRRFRTALPVEDPEVEQWLGRNRLLRRVRVCRSDRISSPLTYGLVRPVILLSGFPGREGQKLKYILQHEMVHIRRFDGIWKLAMTAALCLHWFNPLVWVMYIL